MSVCSLPARAIKDQALRSTIWVATKCTAAAAVTAAALSCGRSSAEVWIPGSRLVPLLLALVCSHVPGLQSERLVPAAACEVAAAESESNAALAAAAAENVSLAALAEAGATRAAEAAAGGGTATAGSAAGAGADIADAAGFECAAGAAEDAGADWCQMQSVEKYAWRCTPPHHAAQLD